LSCLYEERRSRKPSLRSSLWALDGIHLDGDVIITGNNKTTFTGYNTAGFVEIEFATSLLVTSGILDFQNFNMYGGATLWTRAGTPALDAGYGTVIYPTGATGGATAFPAPIVLKAAGVQTVCLFQSTAAAGNLVCNTAMASGANLDTNAGTTAKTQCGGGVIGCFSNAVF
jgi:hypothetical protein